MCITVFLFVQHTFCAVDVILSFNCVGTTPVRGYWDSRVWHRCVFHFSIHIYVTEHYGVISYDIMI